LYRFFATLPRALYVSGGAVHKQELPTGQSHAVSELLCISPSKQVPAYAYSADALFARTPSLYALQELATYRIDDRAAPEVPDSVRAHISTQEGMIDFEKSNGLIKAMSTRTITEWSAFSGCTLLHRTLNSFFYDAFVEVAGGPTLEHMSVRLWSRDARRTQPFCGGKVYAVASGAPAPAVSDVAVQLDLSGKMQGGDVGIADTQMYKGMRAASLQKGSYIALQEERGVTLRPVVYDELLLSGGPSWVLGARSARAELFTSVQKGSAGVLFPLGGSLSWYQKHMNGVICLRPCIRREIDALVHNALARNPFCAAESGVPHARIPHITVLYQDDTNGQEAVALLQERLAQEGLTIGTQIAYLPQQTSFTREAALFHAQLTDMLFVCAMPSAAREFIQQVGVEHMQGILLYGVSWLSHNDFRHFVAEKRLKMCMAHSVSDPQQGMGMLAQEYRLAMHQIGAAISTASWEGYIMIRLLRHALAELRPPYTLPALLTFFQNMKEYSFKELVLTFNPETRDLSQPVWVETGEGLWHAY
jgi:hypothetical protein